LQVLPDIKNRKKKTLKMMLLAKEKWESTWEAWIWLGPS